MSSPSSLPTPVSPDTTPSAVVPFTPELLDFSVGALTGEPTGGLNALRKILPDDNASRSLYAEAWAGGDGEEAGWDDAEELVEGEKRSASSGLR